MGDIDMAVAMPITDAAALFRDAGLKVVETGLEHGTVTVIADGEAIEVTQTRVDLDTDGRHATVAFSDDWRADAARRDFTVNSLYVTADGMVEDPLDCAHQDLDAGRLRFVGEAARRVEEDALRMLRYCRFLPRFHDGGVDAEAMAALSAAAHLAAGLSGERVAGEMRRLLGEEGGQIGLRVMEETGLSLQALGVSTQSDRLTPEIDRLVDVAMGDNGATWLVRLAVVMPLSSAPVLSSRLRLSRREQGELTKFDTVSPETEFAALTGQRWHQAAYWCHREGSLPGPQLIVAAARLMRENAAGDRAHVESLAALARAALPDWSLNGSATHRYPGNLNLRRDGIDGARLLSYCRNVAFSLGSACASGSGRPSHVLRALGMTDAQARGSVRIGFGRYTTPDEVERAARALNEAAAAQAAP